jgi:mannobiose 2-epimerase
LYEAGRELKDKLIFDRVKNTCLRIAEATMQGLQPDGSLIYEKDNVSGHTDFDRHWWAQAEAVVGFYNAFEMSGKNKFLLQSEKSFNYINNNLIDKINGEWYWSIKNDGTINRVDDKAGFWKCPYHNGRMCLELMSRIQSA